jgi:hypothetical protein
MKLVTFLLGLLFNLGDGGDKFLRNVSRLSMVYTALYSKDRTLHNYRCVKLISYHVILLKHSVTCVAPLINVGSLIPYIDLLDHDVSL